MLYILSGPRFKWASNRKTDWDNAEIIVRFCDSKTRTSNVKVPSQRKPITTYSCNAGVRQSKRLRQIKEHGERRRFSVSKSTSLKEIKIMVSGRLLHPLISFCEKLLLRSKSNSRYQLYANVYSIMM